MGPEAITSTTARAIPLRPKYSWNGQAVPWTEVVGYPLPYARALALWRQYHDSHKDSNPTKIPKASRGLCMLSNLYGRAEEYVSTIEQDILASDDATEMIVDGIFRSDAMTMKSFVLSELRSVHWTSRRSDEGYPAFQDRFSTQITRFNGLAPNISIQDSIEVCNFINHNNINASQRINVIPAASTRDTSSPPLTLRSSVDELMSPITYDRIYSIIRPCDPSVSFPSVNVMDFIQQLTIGPPRLLHTNHNRIGEKRG